MRAARRKKTIVVIVLSAILIGILHFYLLPSWSGAYNDRCYLSNQDKDNLAYLLASIVAACKAANLTYWLDYGTLLGAVRFGGILPWDGDGDISILYPGPFYDAAPWVDFLECKGISANMMIATYKNMTVDIMRWKPQLSYHHGTKRTYLYKYYPPSSRDSFVVKLNHKLEKFPFDWIEPRRLIDFYGVKAHIPFHAHSLLRARYPLSLAFRLPYKWKCWLPWFDTKD